MYEFFRGIEGLTSLETYAMFFRKFFIKNIYFIKRFNVI